MEMEKHQKLIAAVNRGSVTHVVMGVVGPHLDSMEQAAITELKHDFRAGNFDQVKMLVKIAQLCNLEDIRSRLTIDVNRGEIAGKELTSNATEDASQ